MGHTIAFEKANRILADELAFKLDETEPNLVFHEKLDRCGMKRFEHCVLLVKLWANSNTTGREKYTRLMQLMDLVTPLKATGTKYRNPQTARGYAMHAALDAEYLERLAREN